MTSTEGTVASINTVLYNLQNNEKWQPQKAAKCVPWL